MGPQAVEIGHIGDLPGSPARDRLPGMEPTDRSQLGPRARARALDDLDNDQFDVVIIGAGVTGAGCALDAATRGLRVGMIEQRDLSSGTSSRSSKLIHGGLRYLEQLNFRLVMEALRERGLLVRDLAPHLVRPVRFLYPLQHRVWERAYVGSGILLYDILAAMGRTNVLPYHRHLSRCGALERIPALRKSSLVGGIEYTIQPGTVIPAGDRLYLSPSLSAFRARASGPTGNSRRGNAKSRPSANA